ncbi:PhoH family protein [Salmonella sp. NW1267]|uniref:CsbD family protein n=1 Tax=Salmonella sp. NW1267 TaxID=2947702 RepID=UPI003F6B9C00
MSLEDKAKNAKDKVSGKAKEVEGKATGDKTREAQCLIQAEQILGGISNVAFVKFTADDVVRNPVVAKIITAYDRVEQR